MQFNGSQKALLETLEFSFEEIAALSELDKETVFKAVSKQKRKLSLNYHPDKNKNDPQLTQKFLAMTKAYEALINTDEIRPSILDGIPPFDYPIPLDCIDLRIEEQIDDYFEKISFAYSALSAPEAKKNFVKEHESFLQFIIWLNKHRSEIHERRSEAFYQTISEPSLSRTLYQDWNKLVLQLFAEENLDDITYREAIALGNLWPILAVRKLLSPLKWLCFLVFSAYNLLTTVLSHFLTKLFKTILADVKNLFSDWSRILPLIGAVALLVVMFSIPSLLLPVALSQVLLSLPLLTRGLFYLANPINHLIRPIAEYFNISAVPVGILTAGLGIAAGAGLAVLFSFSSIITMLLVLAEILAVTTAISSFAVIKKLYDVAPAIAIILGIIELVSLLMPKVPTAAETVLEGLMACLPHLSALGINVLAYNRLSNLKERLSDEYSTLPLPEQNASELVKHVVEQATQKKYWSHTLFNTPEQQKVNPLKENKAWHSMGFFGEGGRPKEHSVALLRLSAPTL